LAEEGVDKVYTFFCVGGSARKGISQEVQEVRKKQKPRKQKPRKK